MSVQSNWWETFFEGVAVDLWLQDVPPEHPEREADFILAIARESPHRREVRIRDSSGDIGLDNLSRAGG